MRLVLVLLLGTRLGAQAQNAAPASPWNIGLKLGTGANYYSLAAPGPRLWTAYTGGLTGGYGFAAAGGFFNLQADALLEPREARPWQSVSATNTVLFVPFYFRTDQASARVHLLLGGGPTVWFTGQTVPAAQTSRYASRPLEATMLAGLEVRLLPLGRYETTVAFTYRHSFTPSLIYYRHSSGGAAFEDHEMHSWAGVTLGLYLHAEARP